MNKQIKILITCALCVMTTWVGFCFLKASQYKKKVYDPSISQKHFIFFTSKGTAEESSFQILSKSSLQMLSKSPFQMLSKSSPTLLFKDSSGEYVKGPSKQFYKLNPKGELLWEFSFLGAPGPALLTKKYVYVGTLNGSLYCLNKSTGEIVWSVALGDTLYPALVVFKDRIIASVAVLNPKRAYIIALSMKNGEVIWSTSAVPPLRTAMTIQPVKGYGLVKTNNNLLLKVDLLTGEIKQRKGLRPFFTDKPHH